MAEDEKTERELEWELFGMAIEDLEKMIRQKSELRNVPMTKVLIDWLEFSQAQLDPKYENVYHILNRIIYLLDEDFIIDNPDKKD
jgi:hypothetical protein